MEYLKECKQCGEEIVEGRSDKEYCNKRCYNRYKNSERREQLRPIRKELKAYQTSYVALIKLMNKYGTDLPIKMTEAVQLGLNRQVPCRSVMIQGLEGNMIGDIAFTVSGDLKKVKLFKV